MKSIFKFCFHFEKQIKIFLYFQKRLISKNNLYLVFGKLKKCLFLSTTVSSLTFYYMNYNPVRCRIWWNTSIVSGVPRHCPVYIQPTLNKILNCIRKFIKNNKTYVWIELLIWEYNFVEILVILLLKNFVLFFFKWRKK